MTAIHISNITNKLLISHKKKLATHYGNMSVLALKTLETKFRIWSDKYFTVTIITHLQELDFRIITRE